MESKKIKVLLLSCIYNDVKKKEVILKKKYFCNTGELNSGVTEYLFGGVGVGGGGGGRPSGGAKRTALR